MNKHLLWSILLAFGLWSCGGKSPSNENNSSNNSTNTQDSATQHTTTTNSSNTGTEQPSGDDEKPDDATTNAVTTVKGYFEGLTNGDYEAAASNFANKVDLWITIKNTTPKAIATEAKRFLSTKENVKYTPNLAGMAFKDNKARVVVRQEWKNYDVTLEVLLELDDAAKIKSYKEGKIYKMKIVKPSALEAYLSKISQFNYPVKVSSSQFSNFKDMGIEGKQLLIGESFPGENFQDVGYFNISGDLVGILHVRGYRSSQEFILGVFNRKSGKMLSLQSIGFMGGSHVLSGYNTSCNIEINNDGSIVNNWNNTEKSPIDGSIKKSSGQTLFQVTPNGQIKRN
ncbi:hypothetical protein BKI52_11925 [marine bacterium AO1-C]|nr:hypothetical protein BKI52_11925 [marine bacterium AO1-C]